MRIFSPGRINLIGEHTDYNGGFVLPSAIDKGITFSVKETNQKGITVIALDLGESMSFTEKEGLPITLSWRTFMMGILLELKRQDFNWNGLEVSFSSNLPIGSGMSSSAALGCGFIFALVKYRDFSMSRIEIAQLAQLVDHKYVGVRSGIMDQFASLHGKSGHAILLDCHTLEHQLIPFQSEDYTFLLINTMVKHSLAESAYNDRRAACERGASLLSARSLREINLSQLEENKSLFDQDTYVKCRYVLEENNRVEAACTALKQGDFKIFGQLMNASHKGLTEDYKVSCEELDFLATAAQKMTGVLGARMMGGGFGGCTINLVEKKQLDHIATALTQQYEDTFGVKPENYKANIAQGTYIIK